MVVLTTLLFATTADAVVDPGEDFNGYMEDIAKREADEEAYRLKLQQHEVHTTYCTTHIYIIQLL